MKVNCLLFSWIGIDEGELFAGYLDWDLTKVNCLLFTWTGIDEGELFAVYLDWD
jgi:hypothetical protein